MSKSSWLTATTAIHEACSQLLKDNLVFWKNNRWRKVNSEESLLFWIDQVFHQLYGFHLEDLHVDGRPRLTCLPFPVLHFDVEVPEYNHEGLRCCVVIHSGFLKVRRTCVNVDQCDCFWVSQPGCDVIWYGFVGGESLGIYRRWVNFKWGQLGLFDESRRLPTFQRRFQWLFWWLPHHLALVLDVPTAADILCLRSGGTCHWIWNSISQIFSSDPVSQAFSLSMCWRASILWNFRYIGVSVVNVWIGRVQYLTKCKKIPMVAWVSDIFFVHRKRGTWNPSRVSLVDYRGHTILDTYVYPT